MSHEISVVNGVAEMFSGNQVVPWHKLGQVVAGLLTAKEAIEAAHLGWQVDLEPIYTKNDGFHEIPSYFGVVRQDTHQAVGVVKTRYTPIQNTEAFDFIDSLVADGQMKYETAGALRGGSLIWIMAKYNGSIKINGDEHKQWCLLVTSHDGSKPLSLQWVTERVVCANTLSIALRGATNRIAIRHAKEWEGKRDEAKRVLGLTEDYFTALQRGLGGLNEQPMTQDDMQAFTRLLFPCDKKDEKDIPTRTSNMRWGVERLFNRAPCGTNGASRWDALNAVTDYADHYATLRGEQSTRLESSLMGSASQLKQRAYDLLTAEDFTARLIAARPFKPTVQPTASGSDDFARLIGQ